MPKLQKQALAITVAQAAIDVFWSQWTGSQSSLKGSIDAAEFWSVQAFGGHGTWVRIAARTATETFVEAHLDHGNSVSEAEDMAVATAVFRVTGNRIGKV